MSWFGRGLGKRRSKFGQWLDDQGITQQDISNKSGVSNSTLSRLSNDDEAKPSFRNQKRLERALKKYDADFRGDDFWGPSM